MISKLYLLSLFLSLVICDSDNSEVPMEEYDTNVLIGTLVGCIALICLIVLILYCCQKSQKARHAIAAKSAFARFRPMFEQDNVRSLVPDDEELDDFNESEDSQSDERYVSGA